MKNVYRCFFFISMVFVLFVGCKTEPKNSLSDPSIASLNMSPEYSQVPMQRVNSFYNGTGGEGISLAILAPQVTGLAENLNYLPTLVQGEFVSNFSTYSAISVLDRENLDKLFAETLSGYYEDDAEGIIRLGHMTNTDYIMIGTITKTSTGYALQMQILNSVDGMTKASYSGTCTIAELDNFTGIRQASFELLVKMGVELTDQAKTGLAGAATTNHVNAQTALAQGITAQRSGTVVEALTYYYEAREYDENLLEANSRLNILTNTITSGNIGENVRNEIQRRNAWLKILTECEDFFIKYTPFEIIINTDLSQDRIDYEKETVNMTCEINILPTSSFNVIQDILTGLSQTGKRKEWGLSLWPMNSKIFTDQSNLGLGWGTIGAYKENNIELQLVNSNGKIVSTSNVSIVNYVAFSEYENTEDIRRMRHYYDFTHIEARPKSGIVHFRNVNANDITDNLVVKIISINEINAELATRNGYIKISMKN
jgi:hypothetical protein